MCIFNRFKWPIVIGLSLGIITTFYVTAIQAKMQGFDAAAQILMTMALTLIFLAAFYFANTRNVVSKTNLEKVFPYLFAYVITLLVVGFADYFFNIWPQNTFFADIFPNVLDSIVTGIVIGWLLQQHFDAQKEAQILRSTTAAKEEFVEFKHDVVATLQATIESNKIPNLAQLSSQAQVISVLYKFSDVDREDFDNLVRDVRKARDSKITLEQLKKCIK